MAKTKSRARSRKGASPKRRAEGRPAGSRAPGRRAEIGRSTRPPRLAPPSREGLLESRRSSIERPASYEERRSSIERPVPEQAPEMEEYEEGGYPRRFSAPKARGYEEDADLEAESEGERRRQEGRETAEPGAEEPVGSEEPLARRRRRDQARAEELSRRGARTLAVPVGRGKRGRAAAEGRDPRGARLRGRI